MGRVDRGGRTDYGLQRVPFTSSRIASPDGNIVAELLPEVGMLCSSLVHTGEQLLDHGKGVEAYAERGATMGIPLLYPWANRLDGFHYAAAGRSVELPDDRSRIPQDPGGLPIHGVVPSRMRWDAESGESGTVLTGTLAWHGHELLELYPFEHDVAIRVVLTDDALTVTTTVHASPETAVPVSFGFHPYLRLPGGDRSSWHVQLPAMDRLALDDRMIPTGERRPMADDERAFALADTSWDDGFVVLEQPARFAVSAAGWGLALELLEGYPFAQIYAPPGHDFICFEPMTAPTNALNTGDGLTVIAPGEEYRAIFRVSAWR
jgi:aldose 1-epimerase